jgi:hypothetical protein
VLTFLEVENFKGIAARQRIDLALLTLLFGANSAGKSTILQALLYLHEVIERGSADIDRAELSGDVLEFGGFARIVHKHDTKRAIVLRAEFDTPGGLERFGRDLADFPFPDLDDEVDSAWIEFTIQHRTATAFQGAMVERVAIGVNSQLEPLVWLETPGSLREGEPLYARINLGHPLVREAAHHVAESWLAVGVPEPPWHRGVDPGFPERGAVIGLDDLLGFTDGRALPLVALSRSRISALPPVNEPLRVIPWGDALEDSAAVRHVRTFLEMIVLGTAAQLATILRESIYIGPLRTVPPRGFLYERAGRITKWADGLAAWDLLLADRRNRVDEANAWLRRLGAGCQLVVQKLFDRSAEAENASHDNVDKTVRRLLLDAGAGTLVLPSEVGAGISQVVPVIVAALEDHACLTMIEQPELHIHPLLQTNLGDLFIVASARRQFLIETHSEHLILRALRRIRETNAGELNDGDPPFTPDKLSVIYVEATADGTTFKQVRVDETGEFVDRWPHGFFEERAKELF